jgi:hypothetical protein
MSIAFSRPTRYRVTAALAVLALSATVLVACGTDNTPIIGDILGGLQNTIDQAIQNAAAQADTTALLALQAAQQAVDQAESAAAQDLAKNLDKVSQDLQDALTRVQGIEQDLIKGGQALLQQATDDAEFVIASIPFLNQNPKLQSYSPVFQTAPTGDVIVHLHGLFAYAFQHGLAPSMSAPGSQLVSNTTEDLDFSVPRQDFSPVLANGFGYTSLQVTVPYEKGIIFKNIKPGVFRLLVTMIPSSPVSNLVVHTPVTTTATNTWTFKFPNQPIYLNSYNCHTDTLNPPIAVYPNAATGTTSAGQFVADPSVTHVEILFQKNSQNVHVGVSASSGSVVLSGYTSPNCILGISDGSGSVVFDAVAEEQDTVTNVGHVDDPVNLVWGGSVTHTVEPGWSITGTLFNGQPVQIGTNSSSRYLNVSVIGGRVQISAPAVDQLTPALAAAAAPHCLSAATGETQTPTQGAAVAGTPPCLTTGSPKESTTTTTP